MPWTDTARAGHMRRNTRYLGDLTDREWALIETHLPGPRRTGRPRTTKLRDVMDALMYMAQTGCRWAMLPKDFPPPSTVQRYFYDWRDNGIWATINDLLVMEARELEGLDAALAVEPGGERQPGLSLVQHQHRTGALAGLSPA